MHRFQIQNKFKLGLYSFVDKFTKSKVVSNKIITLLDPYYVKSLGKIHNKKTININKDAHHQIGVDISNNYNLFPYLERIRDIPIFIAQGSDDILDPQVINDTLVTYLNDAQLEEINDSGHWTVIEQPQEIMRLVRLFFK